MCPSVPSISNHATWGVSWCVPQDHATLGVLRWFTLISVDLLSFSTLADSLCALKIDFDQSGGSQPLREDTHISPQHLFVTSGFWSPGHPTGPPFRLPSRFRFQQFAVHGQFWNASLFKARQPRTLISLSKPECAPQRATRLHLSKPGTSNF